MHEMGHIHIDTKAAIKAGIEPKDPPTKKPFLYIE
jgi:hypothetical protein